MCLWFSQVTRLVTGILPFLSRRWHYNVNLWFLHCLFSEHALPYLNSHHPSWEQAQGVNHRVGGGVGLTFEVLECPQTPLGEPPAWSYQGPMGGLSVQHSQLEPCPYLPHSQSPPPPYPRSSYLRALSAAREKLISPAMTSTAGLTSYLELSCSLGGGVTIITR